MQQKGFATIFGLCFILIIVLIIKGIQESEANHAREILNFEMEQVLQQAAESGIIEAAELNLGDSNDVLTFKKYFKHGNREIEITVKVWHEHGKIYIKKVPNDGIYFMSRASMESDFLSKNIYRRAYAYVLDADDTTINFMELPTIKDD